MSVGLLFDGPVGSKLPSIPVANEPPGPSVAVVVSEVVDSRPVIETDSPVGSIFPPTDTEPEPVPVDESAVVAGVVPVKLTDTELAGTFPSTVYETVPPLLTADDETVCGVVCSRPVKVTDSFWGSTLPGTVTDCVWPVPTPVAVADHDVVVSSPVHVICGSPDAGPVGARFPAIDSGSVSPSANPAALSVSISVFSTPVA
ncbi:hypothetical protein [Haloarcula ordinaria]|uniref:hypothetical protein n=1 Tax=Haloarcula ordinaria TaxID=3033390 RepID=UPI0023E7B87B|nr:hypothetical protein [Halomicroarcula sp. ZS-22-S1]